MKVLINSQKDSSSIRLQHELLFNEEQHVYYVNGKGLDHSVSYFLSRLSQPFDQDTMSQCVAQRDGITQQEVLDKWKKINKEACDLGTRVHAFAEHYAEDRSLKPSDGFEKSVVAFYDTMPSHISVAATELEMYHEKYLFGGTTDVLFYDEKDNSFILGDWKTNKDIFKNYQGQTLQFPFQDMLDAPVSKYQLQLSFYQIMLEQLTDIPIKKRVIVWLRPDGSFQSYIVPDYTIRVKDYLKYYFKY